MSKNETTSDRTRETELITRIRLCALTLGLSVVGGAILALIGAPLAWLIGGMLSVSVAGLAGGVRIYVPTWLRNVVFVLLGMTMGTTADPTFVDAVISWPVSLTGAFVSGIAITVLVALMLNRLFGWKWETAVFSAIPGALSAVVALAGERGGEMARIVTVQVFRVYLLVLAAPVLVELSVGGSANGGAAAQTSAPLTEILWLTAVCAAAGLLAERLRVPASYLIGSFAASFVIHVLGWAEGAPSQLILVPAYVVLGAFMGSRATMLAVRELPRLLLGAVAGVFLAILISGAFAMAVVALTGLDPAQVLLSYAPGALEIMIILAFALDVDPAFVAIHQLLRFSAMAMIVLFLPAFLGAPGENRDR